MCVRERERESCVCVFFFFASVYTSDYVNICACVSICLYCREGKMRPDLEYVILEYIILEYIF